LVDVSNEREDIRRADRAWTAADTLKNVVFMATYPDGTSEPLAVGVPGDREVDVKRIEAALHPAVLRPFEEGDFPKYPALVKGYIGPGALGGEGNIRYLVDPRVAEGTAWITGANEKGRHVYGLVRGRDFDVDGQIEAVEIIAGDPCPRCGATVEIARGIEIGHIFQLGRKYAEALGLTVLDENGKQVTVTMGSYGLGVSRAVAAIAEQHCDDKGLVWPREVAPADVHIVATGKEDAPFETAEELARSLNEAGVRVLIDDRRGASPGVKFKDAELIGIPTIVVVGKRLADGVVELRDRVTGESADVPVSEIAGRLIDLCRA
jgi:prolyl-tRNA synthetase